jgi:hypothetical protein
MPGNCYDYIETTAFIQHSNAVFRERERESERERDGFGGHKEMRILVREATVL